MTGATAHRRIFVTIASFCDPMLVFTIRNAIAMAAHPERLAFGIVEQDMRSVEAALAPVPGRLAWVHVHARQSRGACWARSLAWSLYAGEDYLLQVDSHTCFDKGWDVRLIDAYEAIRARTGNRKAMISTRPFGFELGADGTVRTQRFTDCTLRLVPKERVINPREPVVAFSCFNSNVMDDLPGFQISAAYLFASGDLVEEVPYDPFFYFHGEEQNISIRAYTRGWDIWHPNAVPLYHLYKTRAVGEAPLHWDPQFELDRREKWTDLRQRAHDRLAKLIAGELTGAFGLGAVRSIDDYLKTSGLLVSTPASSIEEPTST